MSHAASTPTHRPALAWFAALGSAWVFVLVTLGAFTTSIGAGMAFEDWPLSNGSVNPEGWLTDIMMFAEHSHRLSAATMGLITLVLACWVQATDPRAWLRRIGWTTVAIVILQGLIGGMRVRLHEVAVPGFAMSLGEMLRVPHGVLAQVFVCLLFAIAASVSKTWIQAPVSPVTRSHARLAVVCVALVLVQLVIAVTMRHNHAGLAIPTFPLAAEGSLLPAWWDFRVTLAFLHRAMALVLLVALGTLVLRTLRCPVVGHTLSRVAGALGLLLLAQISLGAWAIWSARDPYVTTAHVLGGALVFSTTFLLTWWLKRPSLLQAR
ncbi:heme A synthase [Nibricoccus sp. IMCC34717]|uniref:COX15/CtaA family protein n=1 Tax=Nibricoccus sp. IMCC34717 TaxID=3034021 RepID=UPI00384EB0A8